MSTTSDNNKKALNITLHEGTTREDLIADIYSSPNLSAAQLILDHNRNSGLELMPMMSAMRRQAEKIQKGDLSRIEEMLITQAHTLQAIFTKCAVRMAHCDTVEPFKANGNMAMKAQNQCRQTLATLAAIKNPKQATFIKNNAHNQQVNFHSQNKSPEPENELIKDRINEVLDPGRAPAPV